MNLHDSCDSMIWYGGKGGTLLRMPLSDPWSDVH